MNLKALLLATGTRPSGHLRFKAPAEGEGEGGGAAAGATGTEVGGVQRVTVGNDGAADARATAESTSSGAAEGAKPEGLPEGYDTLEAFVSAVNDGTYKPAGGAEATGDETQQAPPATDPDLAKAFEDPRIQPFAAEFAEAGDLKPESITKAAEALGIPEGIVKAYVAAVKAGATAEVTVQAAPFHEAAGGADQWGKFQAWTNEGDNLPPATEKAYLALLSAGKTEEALAVIQPAISAWKAAGGGAPPRDVTAEGTGGGGEGANAGDVYADWSEVQKDQGSEEYRTSPAFREKVYAKLGRSKAL